MLEWMAQQEQHEFSHISCCLLTPAPATCVKNNKEVNRQQVVKRMKVAIAREMRHQMSAEKTTVITFFHELYETKKRDPNVVMQGLKKLKSESAKRDAPKNIIYIHSKGFGGTQFHITMIHNRCNRSIHNFLTIWEWFYNKRGIWKSLTNHR